VLGGGGTARKAGAAEEAHEEAAAALDSVRRRAAALAGRLDTLEANGLARDNHVGEDLRGSGHPVLSGMDGYEDENELEHVAARLRRPHLRE